MAALQSQIVVRPINAIWSLNLLKQHIRVFHSSEDDLISAYALAAAEQMDGLGGLGLQRALITQTWRDVWSDASDIGILRLAPVASISKVAVLLEDGSEHVFDPSLYYALPEAKGTRLILQAGASSGLSLSSRKDRFRCEYVAGYGDEASDVPTPILQAHRLLVGHYYENREAVQHVYAGRFEELPLGARALLSPYKRYGVEAWAAS